MSEEIAPEYAALMKDFCDLAGGSIKSAVQEESAAARPDHFPEAAFPELWRAARCQEIDPAGAEPESVRPYPLRFGVGGCQMRIMLLAAGCVASASVAQTKAPRDSNSLHWDRRSAPIASSPLPPPPTAPLAAATGRNADTLDNDQIIMLARAGLGPEAVIAKINSSRGSYDTSTGALIALKRAGVPDSVIAAMLARSSTPGVANNLAGNASIDPTTPHAPGIYLLDHVAGGRMVRIDATVSNQMKTSGVLGFAFSYGLASMKMKTVIPNPAARARTIEHRPTFYFYFDQAGPMASISQFDSSFSPMASSPNEFSLVRFDEKRDHREAAVGSYSIGGVKTGVSDNARVAFSYEDVAPGVFKVTPSADLPTGQYGFVSSMSAGAGMGMIARIFDFGVS